VAEAQEALQVLAAQHLATGIEIDVEPLGVVDVIHPLGHIHLHAAERVGHLGHGVEVELEVALHRRADQLGHLILDCIRTAEGQQCVGLDRAVPVGLDEGVTGNLRDQGDAVLDLDRKHHIGVVTDVVTAHHQHAAVAAGHRVDDRRQAAGRMDQPGQQRGELMDRGGGQPVAEAEAEGKGQQKPSTRSLRCRAALATRQQFGHGGVGAAGRADPAGGTP